MTPQERLDEIKHALSVTSVMDGGMAERDVNWLIARVEQLEAVILDLYGPDCVAMKTDPKPE